MEYVKTFLGVLGCFALAWVVIKSMPLLERVGDGFEAAVTVIDAGFSANARMRSGLNDDFDDPSDVAFRTEAAAVRKQTKAKNCENVGSERWCQSYEYEDGCWYDGDLSLYWCPRR